MLRQSEMLQQSYSIAEQEEERNATAKQQQRRSG
ncbi:hypothetical protein TIFTF001_032803 [Ficus carica]|uniref:Uncharacterized protein n=1 Tax=Ficus carica TaxID=3494 RepID=A0AA88E0X6_FICCA|nr:hypothetical protein TIFTF001_032803 [Ficus carica]